MVTILIEDEITVGGSGSLVVLDDGAPAAVVIRGPIGTGLSLPPNVSKVNTHPFCEVVSEMRRRAKENARG